MNLQDLQKELIELAQDGRSDVEMRSAIVLSQFGHLVSHMTHDQVLNPTARKYGSPQGEINDAGHFLVQAMTYVALRGIDVETAIETAMVAIRDNDFQKQEIKGSSAQMASPGICCGMAYVIDDVANAQWPEGGEVILVTNHPHSGLAQHTHHLKGIITNEGGLGCHAAIVAREFHLPCVVGYRNATSKFVTGDILSIADGVVTLRNKVNRG